MMIRPGGTGAAGYRIARSLRFNDDDSAYLSRTHGDSPTDRDKFTLSVWIKRGTLGTLQTIFSAGNSTGSYNNCNLQFTTTDTIRLWNNVIGARQETDVKFRDPTAWYHIVYCRDTTLASGESQLYVNGNLVAWGTDGGFLDSPTYHYAMNGPGFLHQFGRNYASASYFDGYLAEAHFIDGQALTPSSFGATDGITGSWNPKEYVGTYGNNGFYLDFANNATVATLGQDKKGGTEVAYQAGDRSAYLSVTSDASYGGAPSGLVDGSTGNNFYLNTASIVGNFIRFDFGQDAQVYCDEITWSQNSTAVSQGFWDLQISNDGSSWTTVKSNFELGTAQDQVISIGSLVGPFRYIRALGVSGSGNIARYQTEVKFRTTNNDFVSANVSVAAGEGNDSLTDTPTNYDDGALHGNFAVLDTLDPNGGGTLSNGALSYTAGSNTQRLSNYCLPNNSTDVWVCEVKIGAAGQWVGINKYPHSSGNAASDANFRGYYINGNKYTGATPSAYGASFTAGDVIGVKFSNGDLEFFKNGSSQGVAFSGLTGDEYRFCVSFAGVAGTTHVNFGQRPFDYSYPGCKALCTQNIPDSESIILSGSFTGNAAADGPVIHMAGVPATISIDGNAVTFGTHADKLSSGFKLRTASSPYNQAGTRNWIATGTIKRKHARAQ